MKLTVIRADTKECLGVVYGRNLEDCLDKAVKKTGRPLKTLENFPNGAVAEMDRKETKIMPPRWAANPPHKRGDVKRH